MRISLTSRFLSLISFSFLSNRPLDARDAVFCPFLFCFPCPLLLLRVALSVWTSSVWRCACGVCGRVLYIHSFCFCLFVTCSMYLFCGRNCSVHTVSCNLRCPAMSSCSLLLLPGVSGCLRSGYVITDTNIYTAPLARR